MTNLSDFVSGGYILLRTDNPDWLQSHDLLPDRVISLSDCICSHVSVHWGWTPGDKESALRFGIPEPQWDSFKFWCHDALESDVDVWSVFLSVDAARRFVEMYLPDTNDLYLVGLGLHRSRLVHWKETPPPDAFGLEKQIARQQPLEDGGVVLGYEVLGYEHGLGHSWLCSGLDRDMYELYGIRPNQYGLIPTYDEARQIDDWIAEDEQQGTRAEPELYEAWLLVSYPLM